MNLFEYAEQMADVNSTVGYGHEMRKDGFYIDGKKVRKNDVLFFVTTSFGYCRFKRILLDDIRIDHLKQIVYIEGDIFNCEEKRNSCRTMPRSWIGEYGTAGWSEKSAVMNRIATNKEMGWDDSVERRWLTEFHNEKEPWLICGEKVKEGDVLVKIDGVCEMRDEIRFGKYKVEKIFDWKWTGVDSENRKWTFFTNDVDFQRSEAKCIDSALESGRYDYNDKTTEFLERKMFEKEIENE